MEDLYANSFFTDIWKETDDIERVGDCTNFEQKIETDSPEWKTTDCRERLCLQISKKNDHARIVDSRGFQKANGSRDAMTEKMERLLSREFIYPGDVIGVSRGVYEHYAVYVGGGKVIHYAGMENDFLGDITIHEADFQEFLKQDTDYFLLSFRGKYPVHIQSATKFIREKSIYPYSPVEKMHCYSPEETIKRAYSRIGEKKYSLVKNNCEHFAMWCKTGIAMSSQVKRIAKYLLSAGLDLGGMEESREDIEACLIEGMDAG